MSGARAGVTIAITATIVIALPLGSLHADAAGPTSVGPVPPRSSVVFFVREQDVRKVPAPGVVVTTAVTGGSGARVAPAQRPGTPTGPSGASASSASDRFGNAYFVLDAGTPGTDTFRWTDRHGHVGQVVVAVSSSARPAAGAVGASAASAGPTAVARPGEAVVTSGTATSASSSPWWRTAVTGIVAAGAAAALLVGIPRWRRRRSGRRDGVVAAEGSR